MKADNDNPNAPEAWENYFKDGWEKNQGRLQTRLFAKYWLETVALPAEARTLLDVGCAMGDAAPEIHERYPHLKITGCDVSPEALVKARESYGAFASFESWGFDDIHGQYDIIYCSNTLEHFVNHVDIAAALLEHCRWLHVLVPYNELRDGQPLKPVPGEYHVATFLEDSFDDLKRRGLASNIRHWLHPCPIAWSRVPGPVYIGPREAGPPRHDPMWKRLLRPIARRLGWGRKRARSLEIFYEITRVR
jgi:SAM-dependent methyltransferase